MDTREILDKSYESELIDRGTITIRVVVLPRLVLSQEVDQERDDVSGVDGEAIDLDDDDLGEQKRPIDSYLEASKRGKGVVVFLVNGQRQHQLDNSIIQRELELKYLRNRMMVIVDVDGLSQQVLSRLMSGARQSFYQGEHYAALLRRVIDTLKDDPDLVRLEEAAAQAVASLRSGDKAVKDALDKLIHEHASRGKPQYGSQKPGTSSRGGEGGALLQTEEAVVESQTGPSAEGPVLRFDSSSGSIRLVPDVPCQMNYMLYPSNAGRILTFQIDSVPPIPDLVMKHEEFDHGRVVTLLFPSPTDDSEPNYPIRATLTALAMVEGYTAPRIVTTHLIINPRAVRSPKPPTQPPILLDVPTFVRLLTRQPITMVAGGSDVHLKLKWDGKDELLGGPHPTWTRRVILSGATDHIEQAAFTRPEGGRFELVLPVPPQALPGDNLSWRIDLQGPSGETLSTAFTTVVVEPLAARQYTMQIEGGREDYENYEIVYLTREEWNVVQCFDHEQWTAQDPGAFDAPTGDKPLRLYINMDYEPLQEFVQEMTRRQLAEATIDQRKHRYTTHMGYHLYQMYMASHERSAAQGDDEGDLKEEAMRHEIARVAKTMLQLMDRA